MPSMFKKAMLYLGLGSDEDFEYLALAETPEASARLLLEQGVGAVLVTQGGDVALTREGGHSHDRIVHSGGDRSGAEVQRTLDESAVGAGVVGRRCRPARAARSRRPPPARPVPPGPGTEDLRSPRPGRRRASRLGCSE